MSWYEWTRICFHRRGRQANHSKDKKIQMELAQLLDRIKDTLDRDAHKADGFASKCRSAALLNLEPSPLAVLTC
jgi:hypothetical protein